MKNIEFNLLDEKWILVRKSDCEVDELSLTDALIRSHEYTGLAGELPTQDVSILRLMLAVLHTVFSRYSPDGQEKPLEKPQYALNRWSELWDAGKFPERPIREYLASQHEKFWLFHPERPFYQTNAAKIGTSYTSAKLNGIVSESNNKTRLFESCSRVAKDTLSYPEAARWLLHLNNYDDTSAKPKSEAAKTKSKAAKTKGEKLGYGWLGKLGMIYVNGDTLFETLMLNLIILNPSSWETWKSEKPTWELGAPRTEERCEIAIPDNLSELYTLQSRRIILHRDNGRVDGYSLLGGDFFDPTDAFCEQMTTWKRVKENNRDKIKFEPATHDSAKQAWREFSSTFSKIDSTRSPGVVSWIDYIRGAHLIEKKKFIKFNIVSIQYGDKGSSVNEIFSDSLSFHVDVLTKLGLRWREKINSEIELINKVALAVGFLCGDIQIAAGLKYSPKDAQSKKAIEELKGHAREQFYYSIDVPFREWLASIDPSWTGDDECAHLKRWRDTAKKIALNIGRALVESAGTAAIVGRMGKNPMGEDKYYSAAKAYENFIHTVKIIYPQEDNNG